MDRDRGPWQHERQAWFRLEGWYRYTPPPEPEELSDGDRALQALEDSGLVRRMLDQVEFEAVRTARREGRSWAEIAVRLGVTRQSAWERWRDIDESASTQPGAEAGRNVHQGLYPGDAAAAARKAAEETVRSRTAQGGSAPETPGIDRRSARAWRNRSTVVVPNVVGMPADRARKVLEDKHLAVTGSDPDGPPLGELSWTDGVVTDQSPESGAKVPPGSVVRLWIESGGGGGSGVREPRRPLPDPMSGRQMRDETTGDAVSGSVRRGGQGPA
ncbi:MAG TPA: PASTA domain-containing protein [Actinocrinis sp.]|uniref:PASTA domain-containing protein n=1 Tax=Actinocrinis sp. TaxID=1920516 RepID=UPI002DDCC2F8|nr:PASTA domain-containing protein [Actinocrinis sp.]HEV2342874.1 PASTA domain-containing protein [Actinocrinis sp.]